MHVQVLQPAIELAENGFPVSPVTACVRHPTTPLPAQTLLCIMICTCLLHVQYYVWVKWHGQCANLYLYVCMCSGVDSVPASACVPAETGLPNHLYLQTLVHIELNVVVAAATSTSCRGASSALAPTLLRRALARCRHQWAEDAVPMMKASGAAAQAFMSANGRPPRAGQLQRNPDLAKTFRSVAEHGALEGADPRLKISLQT